MPNSNCLKGMRCLGCKSEGPFMIEVPVSVVVNDDGTDWPKSQDIQWTDDSPCLCAECDYAGRVRHFTVEWQEKHIANEEDHKLIGYCEIHCETDRALFNGKDVARMFELAGEPLEHPPSARQFISMHQEMAELCKKARARHR